ncbi:MAG: M23 family metallopeptidase [Phycisphaerae bacterium]|nr:M23 family metallopeptidase [Phycisphaerae bacterium]
MTQQRLHVFLLCAGLCLVWGVWPCPTLAESHPKGADQGAIKVHKVQSPEGTVLEVENLMAYDVTLNLTFRSRNTRIVRYKAETDTFPGQSRTRAVLLQPEDRSQPWSWRYRTRWLKGDMHALHDDSVLYRLPFEKNKSFRVIQSYHGQFSHQGINEYTVDFAMREGTSVCAARGGLVVDMEDQYDKGGVDETLKDRSNFVTIAHADGTLGEYHHLKYLGVLVEVGQHVSAGDVIGLSGNTGYSSLPHLHFGVYSPKDSVTTQSHPVAFFTSQGVIREPVKRRHYAVP